LRESLNEILGLANVCRPVVSLFVSGAEKTDEIGRLENRVLTADDAGKAGGWNGRRDIGSVGVAEDSEAMEVDEASR
jgi:hypothetical protein